MKKQTAQQVNTVTEADELTQQAPPAQEQDAPTQEQSVPAQEQSAPAPEDNGKNKKTGRKVAKIIGNVLFYTVVSFIIIVGIISVIGKATGKNNGLKLFGYNFFLVGSSSMSRVHPDNAGFLAGHDDRIAYDEDKGFGDLIITKSVPDDYELQVYDVVTFVSNGNTIVHRIVDIVDGAEGKMYVTRGDSNNADDGMRTKDEFTGILVANGGMGWAQVIHFLQSGYGIAAVSGALAVILAAMLVSGIIDEKAKKKKEAAASGTASPDAEFDLWAAEDAARSAAPAPPDDSAGKENAVEEPAAQGGSTEKETEKKESAAKEDEKKESAPASKKSGAKKSAAAKSGTAKEGAPKEGSAKNSAPKEGAAENSAQKEGGEPKPKRTRTKKADEPEPDADIKKPTKKKNIKRPKQAILADADIDDL